MKKQIPRTGESSKLVSLLALAAGAVAIPQTSNADIIFTDLSASPPNVGALGATSFVISTLPGDAQLGVQFFNRGTSSLTSTHFVKAGQVGGYVRVKTAGSFVVHVASGPAWNQMAGAAS